MTNITREYFEALERLKNNAPINVPRGSKINNDTVALEAGRKRGSIKKNREVFSELIEAIKNISVAINEPTKKYETKIKKLQEKEKKYKELYEEALNRELMLLERLNEIEKKLSKNPYANNV